MATTLKMCHAPLCGTLFSNVNGITQTSNGCKQLGIKYNMLYMALKCSQKSCLSTYMFCLILAFMSGK